MMTTATTKMIISDEGTHSSFISVLFDNYSNVYLYSNTYLST